MKGVYWQDPTTRVAPQAIRDGTSNGWKDYYAFDPQVLTYSRRSEITRQGLLSEASGFRKRLASRKKKE